ncbi:MAG TPA: class I SAM-dependent methyltransferase [Thermoanaerobaculia bacterium]|nr:class I SAM-dependent methyltransferase [Thermoanaerobaculia bacterium]
MNTPDPPPHVWTPATVTRFWNHMAGSPALEHHYFAAQVGAGVVRLLGFAAPLADREVLDLGCGPGMLTARLLEAGARAYGSDTSAVSVAAVNARFRDQPGWGGARLTTFGMSPWPDASFDVVCCVETVEHVLETELVGFLGEIFRLLRPGGRALLTTPNDENLGHEEVLCPACGTVFHRWQHVRSWRADSLAGCLTTAGFNVLFCRGLDFRRMQRRQLTGLLDFSARKAGSMARNLLEGILDGLAPKAFPHGRRLKRLLGDPFGPHLAAVVERPRT